MADPFAITGLVFALVQGGLQLYTGISEYLDAVETRFEELDFARRQALDMRRSLEIIEQLAPKLASKYAASSSSLESSLRSCELDIKALNDLLLELIEPGPSGEGLRSRLHRVQARAKKLTFPFSRPKIDRLEKRLAMANGALSTALNTANLEASLVIQDHVSDLHHLLTAMLGANTGEARIATSTRALSHQSRPQIGSDSLGDKIALFQLVSKPGYLRSAMDELKANSPQPLQSSWPSSDLICSCRFRRRLTRHRQVWSSLAVSSEFLSSAAHDPDCQCPGPTDTRQTFGTTLEYTGLRRLFQKAIRLSFHMTFGAGGFSVNPGITFVPLVDYKSAPTFRLVNLLHHVKPKSNRSVLIMIEIMLNSILILYSQRRASPKDTDVHGRSLMHHLADVTASFTPPIPPIQSPERLVLFECNINNHKQIDAQNNPKMLAIEHSDDIQANEDLKTMHLVCAKRLIASGVPAMLHDDEGQSAAVMLLLGLWRGDLGPMLATSLISAEPDETLFSTTMRSYKQVPENRDRVFFPQWPALAEAAGYGLLCSATASGNEAAVSTILATTPSALRESNIFGQSPLHLAVHHPSCLRVLIKAAGGDESLLNTLDADSRSPLDYGMLQFGIESLDSVELLLEADCAVRQTADRLFETRDDKWKPIIEAMKDRRERLKDLAIKVFDDDEIKAWGLEEGTVLDGDAAAVWRLLLDRGISVPQALSPVRQDCQRCNYTMYHQVFRPRQLEDLWTLGFRDINMLDDEGRPPLMDWRWDVVNGHYEPKCEWLINHGANLEEPLRRKGQVKPEAQSITVCHNLFRQLGINFMRNERSHAYYEAQGRTAPGYLVENIGSGRIVIERLLMPTLDDACGCKCSRRGCTPFIWFLKFLPASGVGEDSFPWEPHEWSTETRPHSLAGLIKEFTAAFGSTMSQGHLSEAVRCLTHTALGLKHTCCEAAIMRSPIISSVLDPDNRQLMSAEEKEELEFEQASLIVLLDSLVTEFEEKSQEDRGGAPLWRANPAEFWIQVWAARMDGVIADLDGADLTQEEIRAAEDVGVEWKSPQPEKPTSNWRPRYTLTLDEFKEEVDRIMSEC